MSSVDIEQGTVAIATTVPKPKQRSRLLVILLDQGLFTVYKRLFTVNIVANVAGIALGATGAVKFEPEIIAVANILALTLCRSEVFLRLLFWLTVKVLGHRWIPLKLKTMATSLLQNIGGIHSSCGVASVAWLTYTVAADGGDYSPEILAVAYSILALTGIICVAAFPLIRHLHHNLFERIHRFCGWSALILLWVFVILSVGGSGDRLLRSPVLWFTAATTVCIVTPWLSVRKVAVKVSSPSGHASIIRFQGGVTAGLLGRISPSPFSEWHAFGIISDGVAEHLMIAGAVGDFTRALVERPPTHLWVRKVRFAGIPYLVNLYSNVLVVATGSGIAVFLSMVLQSTAAEVHVLWVAKDVEKNFGPEIHQWMTGRNITVHDTAILGRPNVAQMTVEAARKCGAEVVIVTSNPQGSRDVVDSCKSAGIPAYGPVWDS